MYWIYWTSYDRKLQNRQIEIILEEIPPFVEIDMEKYKRSWHRKIKRKPETVLIDDTLLAYIKEVKIKR